MRAVTTEELEQIAIGLSKDLSWSAHPLLKKPPTLPPIKVTGTYIPPIPSPGPSAPPPPSSGGGGGGGGSGESPAQKAASAAEDGLTFATAGMQGVDYSYIFHWENRINPLLVDVPPSSTSGVTIAYGVDLASQSSTTLQGDVLAGYLSQSLANTLAPLTGKDVIGSTAKTDLSASGLTPYPNVSGWYELPSTTSTSSLQQLSESVYGQIMENVNQDFANATEYNGVGGAYAGTRDYATYLPPNTATALTDVSQWWGKSGMENNLDGGTFWGDLTHYDWSAAANALEAEAKQPQFPVNSNGYNRLMQDAGKIDQDVGSGKLVNGLPASG